MENDIEKVRSRWSWFRKFEISNVHDASDVYLTRWRFVESPWFSVMLHRMSRADGRPIHHDHPSTFIAFVLRGSYFEKYMMRPGNWAEIEYSRWIRWINFKPAEHSHYIAALGRTPTWTLVFSGPRRRTWGYWRRWSDADYQLGQRFSTWIAFDKDHVVGEGEQFNRVPWFSR